MTKIEMISGPRTVELPETGSSGWVFNNLVDWYTLTADKAPVEERPQADGAFGVPRSFRSVSTPSFRAVFLGGSASEYLDGVDALTAIGAAGPVVMRVTDARRATERVVSVETAAVVDHHGRDTGFVAVDCVARDPRRYEVDAPWVTARPPREGGGLVWPVVWSAVWGGESGSDGRVRLHNAGSRSSFPVYRIYGGFSSATITNVDAQKVVGFALPVPGGSFVEIDFAKRTALLDGVSDVTRYITNRAWWDVPAGSTVAAQIALTGASVDPYLAGKVRAAW